MSEYLSKEEIKQWRSSLEKITLEEYAARLGKKVAEEKTTNDLADIVLHGQPVISYNENWNRQKTEHITTIAQRAMEREQEIAPSPFSIEKLKISFGDIDNRQQKTNNTKTKTKNTTEKTATKISKNIEIKKDKKAAAKSVKVSPKAAPKTVKAVEAFAEVVSAKSTGDVFRDDIRIIFKKALTDREQKVFDYFAEHKNEVVYAKDLATLLDLPRDYVYKYIKNLRAKIDGEKLENADKGGFILHI